MQLPKTAENCNNKQIWNRDGYDINSIIIKVQNRKTLNCLECLHSVSQSFSSMVDKASYMPLPGLHYHNSRESATSH